MPLLPPIIQIDPTPLADQAVNDLINTMISNVTSIPPSLVRPRWQPTPPAQPAPNVNWCAAGITQRTGQGFTFQRMTVLPGTQIEALLQRRWLEFDVLASFYGPDADDLAFQLVDGAQLSQNLSGLYEVGIKIRYVNDVQAVPELINMQWIDHQDVRISMVREFDRYYRMESLIEANGTLVSDTGVTTTLDSDEARPHV